MIPMLMETLVADCSDERSPLTFEVMRWIFDLSPDYIMLEQVPAALPIWEAIAEVLESWGYAVWTGNVQAEQYGVPQTRKRAILMATLHRTELAGPVPTHSKYHNRTPDRLDEGVQKWVSMAEALDWGMTHRPYPTIAPGTGVGGPDSLAVGGSGARKTIYAEHAEGRWVEHPDYVETGQQWYDIGGVLIKQTRSIEDPAPTVTGNTKAWKVHTHMGDVAQSNGTVRPVDAPAPTLTASMDNGNFRWVDREALVKEVEPRVNNQSGTEFDLTWPADRPAPVIAGRDLVTMPGANANRFNGSTKSRNDGIRVTVEEAGVLQSFPATYPWKGTKTKKFQQVGNAVPPLLQCKLTQHLLGV
jgi:DNA (cytosine-5)-methyltransferase 1